MVFKDDQLVFRCFECKKYYLKNFNKNIWLKDLQTCISFAMKTLNNKNLGDDHDLYVQSNTLLLANVFENFRNKCIKMSELDPAHFLLPSRLAWQAYLNKIEVKLELLTNVVVLLMVEKGVRGGMSHAMHKYAKANNKYIKNYNESKDSSYIYYLDVKKLYGWAMIQKLPVDSFKWKKKTKIWRRLYKKTYDEGSNKAYIFEVDVACPKKLHDLHGHLPFLLERIKINKYHKFLCNLSDKNNYVVYIRSLKQTSDRGIISLKKVYKVIQFNQRG